MTNNLRVEPVQESPHDGHGQQVCSATGCKHDAGQTRCITHEGLQVDRQQDERSKEVHHKEEYGHISEAEGIVPKYLQINNGPFGAALHNDEQGKGEHRDDCKGKHEIGIKPVVPLAPVEEELEAPHAGGEQDETEIVDLHAYALHVGRVYNEQDRHDDGDNTDGDIDEEYPVPGEVVGDPSSENRTDDGPERDADPEDGHGHAVLLRGE